MAIAEAPQPILRTPEKKAVLPAGTRLTILVDIEAGMISPTVLV